MNAAGQIAHFLAAATGADLIGRGLEKGAAAAKRKREAQKRKRQQASRIAESRAQALTTALRTARPVLMRSAKKGVEFAPELGVALGVERTLAHIEKKDKKAEAAAALRAKGPRKEEEVTEWVGAALRGAGAVGKFALKHGKSAASAAKNSKLGVKAAEKAGKATKAVKSVTKDDLKKYGKKYGKDVAIFTGIDQGARAISRNMDKKTAATTDQAKKIDTANATGSLPIKPGFEKGKNAWQPTREFNSGGSTSTAYAPRTSYTPDKGATNPKTAATIALMRSGQTPSAPDPTKSKVLVSKQANATRKGGAKKEDIEEIAVSGAIATGLTVASLAKPAWKLGKSIAKRSRANISKFKTKVGMKPKKPAQVTEIFGSLASKAGGGVASSIAKAAGKKMGQLKSAVAGAPERLKTGVKSITPTKAAKFVAHEGNVMVGAGAVGAGGTAVAKKLGKTKPKPSVTA